MFGQEAYRFAHHGARCNYVGAVIEVVSWGGVYEKTSFTSRSIMLASVVKAMLELVIITKSLDSYNRNLALGLFLFSSCRGFVQSFY